MSTAVTSSRPSWRQNLAHALTATVLTFDSKAARRLGMQVLR